MLKQEDIKLIRIKDYSSNPKESGYRSLHVVIEVPIFLVSKKYRFQLKCSFGASPWILGQVWNMS